MAGRVGAGAFKSRGAGAEADNLEHLTLPPRERLRMGLRIGIPYAVAALVLSISFGVLAAPIMGNVAPIVMSVLVFAGSAQFASTAVLGAGWRRPGGDHPRGSCSTCATCRWGSRSLPRSEATRGAGRPPARR